jgi:hypothetical protein
MRIFLCALVTLCAFAASMPAHARPNVTGLDRANQVAGDHGQQGRDNAALHQATQNGSFTTELATLLPSTNHGGTVSVPEPTSLVLVTSGLVGLWFVRLRRKS